MRRLNIGPERKLEKAHMVLRRFVTEMIARRKINGKHVGNGEEQESVEDILSCFIKEPDYADDENLLCATLVGTMLAGRDTVGTTLPWIFYVLAQNPDIVSSIRNELSAIASCKVGRAMGSMVIFEPEETKSLVYLKAVCQAIPTGTYRAQDSENR
jgi:cytochrome P450